jgi:tRNA(fMet)-specific endonuclease VapC
MIVLDSDHVTVLRYPESPAHATLLARMRASLDRRFATTAISVEEQMRGWLSLIHRVTDAHKQIPLYDRLLAMFEFFREWEVLRFDAPAADQFEQLRAQRVRIGVQDLKIAATALANDALLLSANLKDFRRVPDLRVESWLQEPATTP